MRFFGLRHGARAYQAADLVVECTPGGRANANMIVSKFLEKGSPTPPISGASAAEPTELPVDAANDDTVIACAACDHVITTERERVERFGGHAHDRVNPAGIAFRILLFARAPGARLVDSPSPEFAWFPHHLWQIALCARCRSHLGWSFASPDGDGGGRGFFGLREDAIHRRSSAAPS
ncbi:MAG: cereblon family protein [Polyangiaceae bacterium]